MMRAALAFVGMSLALLAGAPAGAPAEPAAGGGQAPATPTLEVGGSADSTLITLSTPAEVPAHRWAFQLTHRFFMPLDQGSFHDLASNFFSLDGPAQIGLGLRYGLTKTTQLAVYRTSDRDIAFLARQELVREQGARPFAAIVASIEGLDNFSQEYSPRVGVSLAHTLDKRLTLYAEPAWVGHTDLGPKIPGESRSTLVLGLGGRLRVAGPASLVAEWTPRLAGFKARPGETTTDQVSFGITTDVGGHSFQLNVSNNLGTTPAQVARGQRSLKGWFLGFNLVRRFY